MRGWARPQRGAADAGEGGLLPQLACGLAAPRRRVRPPNGRSESTSDGRVMFSVNSISLGNAIGGAGAAVLGGGSATVNDVVVAVPGSPDILHNILAGASAIFVSDFDVYGQIARDIIGA
jgi:hypothetical protein